MSITTSRVRRRDLETELASGSVDLAIEIPMTVSDRIRHKWLLHEQFVVMARQGHPAIKNKLDLETYVAQRHVHISSRRHGPSLVDIELSRRGLRRNVVLRSQHNLTGCLVVSQTDMLLTLPERHAKLLNASLMNGGPRKGANGAQKNETRMNQVYPFPLAIPRLEAHLYWHESVENDPANRWLRKEIEDVLTAGETSNHGAGRARVRGAKKRGKAS